MLKSHLWRGSIPSVAKASLISHYGAAEAAPLQSGDFFSTLGRPF
jgi:hypothetical protein